MTTVPPSEIVNKRKLLLQGLNDDDAAIKQHERGVADLLAAKKKKQEAITGLDITLRTVYGWTEVETLVPKSLPRKENGKRKIPLTEYRDILVSFLKEKLVSRPMEMRKKVSEVVGFEVKDDALSKAVRLLCENREVPITKGTDKLYRYDESKLPQQPAMQSHH